MAFKIPNFYSKSPLHGSYYNPKGETYISEVGMIQDAANAVASAGLTIDAKNKKAETDASFKEKAKALFDKGLDENSAEYKKLYVDTYGAVKPEKEKDKE